ncbi:right-handed parallel beta-helix repeat-containing protein [Halocatena marina]|uniref:right-handed parallel beta-helix repeat-containing protein n=1 Tax=Halocatena marina TaxID=2934937 RepID=UPI0034A212D8
METVDAVNPDPGGGYAGFRVANGAGPDITVQNVTVRGGARGVFGVSGSHGFTIENVDVEETEVHGILIQDGQNASINGGTARNTYDEGVRIDSRSGPRARCVSARALGWYETTRTHRTQSDS